MMYYAMTTKCSNLLQNIAVFHKHYIFFLGWGMLSNPSSKEEGLYDRHDYIYEKNIIGTHLSNLS